MIDASDSLERRRRSWCAKPALRAVYEGYAKRIRAACRPGRVLEIGAGAAGLDDACAIDIRFAPWLDAVADAQCLPFAAESFDNVVMIDVLHHLAYPRRFFDEVGRVLRPGGRIVLIEPAITPLSWPVYRFLHDEALDLTADPLGEAPLSDAAPECANQAIPTLLFGRHRARFAETYPNLAIRCVRHSDLWAYPLSGGFRRWCMIPASWVPVLLRIEDALAPMLGRLAGFRMMIVAERRA